MTEKMAKKPFGLTSNQLRGLALFFMLLDHMWATVVGGQMWMTCVGRMAFPIFAFLIGEGYAHTHDFKAYAKRLFWFGVISEIPFNMMMISAPIFPFHQNVMFTLLLGLLSIHLWEQTLQQKELVPRLKKLALCFLCIIGGGVFMTDYGMMGVVTVLLFWVCRNLPYRWAFQLAGMIVLNVFAAEGQVFPLSVGSFTWDFPLQGFAVFALLFIWLYNGEKGSKNKWLQYGTYAFYPVHMLVLSLITYLQ